MKFNLQKKVDLSRFHTFGTRQIAKYLIQVNDLEDLDSALDFALKAEVPFSKRACFVKNDMGRACQTF